MMKERKMRLIPGETAALFALYKKAFPFLILTVILTYLFLVGGMLISLQTVDFGSYAVRTGKISQLIVAYLFIAGIFMLLLILATVLITYVIAHNIIAPIIRITRDLQMILNKDPEAPQKLSVRAADAYLLPLVEEINKLI